MQQSTTLVSLPTTRLDFGPSDRRLGGILASLAVAGATLAVAVGNASLELLFLLGLATAAVVLLQPRAGLYLIILLMAVDQAAIDPITSLTPPIFSPLRGSVATPLEMLILVTLIAWVINARAEGERLLLPPKPLLIGSGLLVLLLVLALIYGASTGGDLVIGLWEVRALLSVPPLMLVASGLIQTRRHLKELAFVVVAALSLLVIDLLWRYFFFIRPTIEPDRLEAAFSHENGILIALLIAIGGAGLLWEKTWGRRFLWLAVATLAVVLLLVLRRRTGLVAGEAALLALGVALLLRRPARFALVGPLVLALTVGYLTIYWNHPNGLGQPARAFRTVIGSEVKTERDRASDEYRKAESLNVWWNIQAKPIIGTGLGKPYPKPLYFVNLSYFWPFWDFIPHNTVLHLWMKAGVFAFMAFIYLVGTGISQSLSIVRASRDRWVVASASVIAAYIVMTVLFSYVDLGLTNTRVMVPFGVALGIIGPLQRLVDRESAPEAAPVAGAL